MRRSAPIVIKMYYPCTSQGSAELAARVAMVHADTIRSRLAEQDCPAQQKLDIIDAISRNPSHVEM